MEVGLRSLPVLTLCVFVALFVASQTTARSLFESQITSGAETVSVGTGSLQEVPDLFSVNRLQNAFPGFNPLVNSFSASLDARGLPLPIAFNAGTQTISVTIPGGSLLRFDEGSLTANLNALENWFKGDFNSATATAAQLDRLLHELVASSPVDPVAGNPNSLLSKMANADYRLGASGPFLSRQTRPKTAPDQAGAGFRVGHADADSFSVQSFDLPLDYRANFQTLPELSLIASLPISLTLTEGEWSLMGSVGFGAQVRMFDVWALTPMLRFGTVGSLDVGAAAFIPSGTVTSHLDAGKLAELWLGQGLPGDLRIGIVQQLGYAETVDTFSLGGFQFRYGIEEVVIKNGGYLSGRIGTAKWAWRIFGHDTRFVGSPLFLNAEAELGVAAALHDSVGVAPYEVLHLGLSYVGDFDRYNGVSVGVRGRY